MIERVFQYSTTVLSIDQLLKRVNTYLPDVDADLIRKAYDLACRIYCHRHPGVDSAPHDYILYPAFVVADLRLDEASIAAALICGAIQEADYPLDELANTFDESFNKLLKSLHKIQHMAWSDIASRSESALSEVILGMFPDLRVEMIQLAIQLHTMQTLDERPPEIQQQLARDTMEIYAPLAYHLGIWALKSELEDLAFRYLYPTEYTHVSDKLTRYQVKRQAFINQAIETTEAELWALDIPAEVFGRAKHLYGIYQKMVSREKTFEEIYDAFAIRIVVPTVKDCYTALSVVHALWTPMANRVKDYISVPRNFYRALHTTLLVDDSIPLEVQIRARDMHIEAEYGVAAHWRYRDWRYKQFGAEDSYFVKRISELRQLTSTRKNRLNARDFVELLKPRPYQDRVYALTPEKKVVNLPTNSTPIDFAYHIHTEIGHRCRGAKVNGKLVKLNYQLKNGDQVEILTGRKGGPSRDWLNESLGYAKTSRARKKIRHWFKRQNFQENVSQGRAILERDFRRFGIGSIKLEELAERCGYNKLDDFLAAVGYGHISTHHFIRQARKLLSEEEKPTESWPLPEPESDLSATDSPDNIQVMGTSDLLTNLAKCCHPLPGDPIMGYITRGRGVTIHRRDCPNVANLDDPERLIQVGWGNEPESSYTVDVIIKAFQQNNLARQVNQIIADEKIDLKSLDIITRNKNSLAELMVTLEVNTLDRLTKLLEKIRRLPNVVEIRRS